MQSIPLRYLQARTSEVLLVIRSLRCHPALQYLLYLHLLQMISSFDLSQLHHLVLYQLIDFLPVLLIRYLHADDPLEDNVEFVADVAPLEDVLPLLDLLVGEALADLGEVLLFDFVALLEKLDVLQKGKHRLLHVIFRAPLHRLVEDLTKDLKEAG